MEAMTKQIEELQAFKKEILAEKSINYDEAQVQTEFETASVAM